MVGRVDNGNELLPSSLERRGGGGYLEASLPPLSLSALLTPRPQPQPQKEEEGRRSFLNHLSKAAQYHHHRTAEEEEERQSAKNRLRVRIAQPRRQAGRQTAEGEGS